MVTKDDISLRRRKKAQAYLSTGSALLGVGALGAMGTKAGAGKLVRAGSRSGVLRRPVPVDRVRDKADSAMNRLTVGSVGLGGISSANFASVQNREAKRIKKDYEGVGMDFGLSGVRQGEVISKSDTPVQLHVRSTTKKERSKQRRANSAIMAGGGAAVGGMLGAAGGGKTALATAGLGAATGAGVGAALPTQKYKSYLAPVSKRVTVLPKRSVRDDHYLGLGEQITTRTTNRHGTTFLKPKEKKKVTSYRLDDANYVIPGTKKVSSSTAGGGLTRTGKATVAGAGVAAAGGGGTLAYKKRKQPIYKAWDRRETENIAIGSGAASIYGAKKLRKIGDENYKSGVKYGGDLKAYKHLGSAQKAGAVTAAAAGAGLIGAGLAGKAQRGLQKPKSVSKAFDPERSRRKRMTAYSHGAAGVAGAGALGGGVLVAQGAKGIKEAKSVPKYKAAVRTTGKGAAVSLGAVGAGVAANRINSYKNKRGSSYRPRYISQ